MHRAALLLMGRGGWLVVVLGVCATGCSATDGGFSDAVHANTPRADPSVVGNDASITGAPSGGQPSGTASSGGGQPAGVISTNTPGSAPGASGNPAACAGISAMATARLLPVDIIWAIDTSGSMVSAFPAIQQALTRFSAQMDAAGIDAHIVLLAGQGLCVPPPLGSGQCGGGLGGFGGLAAGGGGLGLPAATAPDTKQPNFLHLDVPFGFSAGMGVLLDEFPNYRQLLRPGARTHLVLTEDGPPPMTAQDVANHIEGRASATFSAPWSPGLAPGSWVFSGVVCATDFTVGGCAFLLPDTTLALIQSSGGVLADLAQVGLPGSDPFAKLLEELARKVIVGAELSCEYDIPPTPPGETFDRARVNVAFGTSAADRQVVPRAAGSCGDAVAWTYDNEADPKKIELCPAACTRLRALTNAALSVEFGCATQVLLL